MYKLRQTVPLSKPVLQFVFYLEAQLCSYACWNHGICLQILVVEGLHPFFDERVRDLCDFKLYLDISDDVKFAWKLQRDSQERGHSVESIKQSIESRKPDFDAYIDPQKKHADIILQVCARHAPLSWHVLVRIASEIAVLLLENACM